MSAHKTGSKRPREDETVGDDLSAWQLLNNLKSASDAIQKRIVSSTNDIEVIPTLSAVKDMIPLINTAGQLLVGARIEVVCGDKISAFDIIEAEAYIVGPNHNDTFSHVDPQQAVFGTFYFHRMGPGKSYKGGSFKGMDISIGPLASLPATAARLTAAAAGTKWSYPSPFYGGYLIRTVRNNQNGEIVEGPSLVVDALLAAAQKGTITNLVEETGRRYLTCDGKDSWVDGASAVEAAKKGTVPTMRLVPNPLTAPTVANVVDAEGATGALEQQKDKGLGVGIPSHILLAPRVGLIPRTVHDLRYGGAFYRYINVLPGDIESAAKQTAAKAKKSACVQLAKVRSGIVAALMLQQLMKGVEPDALNKPLFLDSLRTSTGATNAAISGVKEKVMWLSASDPKTASPAEVGKKVVQGDSNAHDDIKAVAAQNTQGDKNAMAFIKTVLGEDVKKAEVIARVAAIYAAYIKEGLGIKW